MNIRFVGDNRSFPHVPAWQILDKGTAETAQLADRIVLVGFTAEGQGDQWFTPFSASGQKISGWRLTPMRSTHFMRGVPFKNPEQERFFAGPCSVRLAVVVAGPTLRRTAILRGRDFDRSVATPGFMGAHEVLQRLASGAAVLGCHRRGTARPGSRQNRSCEPRPGSKIERLSGDWLAALYWYEPEWPQAARAVARRKKLLAKGWRNSRWKLDAIDFFNEELMRFLSFNLFLQASEDVIVVCDPDGRVVYQNPAAKRLTGYRDNPGQVTDYLESVLDGRDITIQPGVLHFVPANDGKTFYNVTVAAISTAGVVFSLHDATAQHELDQAKSEMVSLVSHELRTPLTSIRGYSDMLLKYNLVEDNGREFLKTIIDESNRLNQLIQSFLDIAYIESGRQKITNILDFEIEPVLADMLNIIGPVAAEKQINLDLLN